MYLSKKITYIPLIRKLKVQQKFSILFFMISCEQHILSITGHIILQRKQEMLLKTVPLTFSLYREHNIAAKTVPPDKIKGRGTVFSVTGNPTVQIDIIHYYFMVWMIIIYKIWGATTSPTIWYNMPQVWGKLYQYWFDIKSEIYPQL